MHVRQTFNSTDEFISVLRDYAIKECFYLNRVKNVRVRVITVCGTKDYS